MKGARGRRDGAIMGLNQSGWGIFDMDLIGAVLVAAILIGIFALMWQMHFQSNRIRDELRDEIRENREAIKSTDHRISDVERNQARLEGVNDVVKRQSHTHKAHTHEEDSD